MRTNIVCSIIFIIFFITIVLLPILAQSATNSSSNAMIDWWCDQTPYPAQCKLSLQNHVFPIRRKSQFKNLVIDAATKAALKSQGHNKWLKFKCRNHKELAALVDCLNLYQLTIDQLNRTTNAAPDDMQTWLSTSLTNIDTCRTGFRELGVTDYVLPLMSNNNVSQLITNALALAANNASQPQPSPPPSPQTNSSGVPNQKFPSWLSVGDRKLLQTTTTSPDLVVAKDGTGNFRSIQQAIDNAAKRSGSRRFVIYVKRGVYEENISIGSGNGLKNIMLAGDGIRYTIITGSRSVGGGFTTFNSATLAVTADGFIARGITIRNSAGAQNHQAVALRSGADLSVFYRCGFEGYQDTLYVHSQRQFYKECYIYGTVDFIFGNAAVVFQNCMMYVRRPMSGQQNMITAQGRTDPNQNTGISIQNSRVMAAPDLAPVVASVKSYLGRPWKQYSRTVFMQTYIDSLIDPAGWFPWDGNFALDTLYYGEYKNFGPGSSTSKRVNWKGYRIIQNSNEASQFTIASFIAGRSWLPATGVPFTAGL